MTSGELARSHDLSPPPPSLFPSPSPSPFPRAWLNYGIADFLSYWRLDLIFHLYTNSMLYRVQIYNLKKPTKYMLYNHCCIFSK